MNTASVATSTDHAAGRKRRTSPRASASRDLVELSRRFRVPLVLFGAVAVGALASQYKQLARAVLAAAALLLFALVARTNRRTALVLVVLWLSYLGFFRRLLIPFAGWNAEDPLLLVSPAFAVVLWHFGSRGRIPKRSLLGSLGLVLLLSAAAHIVNPAEPSILVAFQSALFWLTPFLWFFAGRTFDAEEQGVVLTSIFWAGIPVTAHGLYQTFFGLLPFEYTWLDHSGPGEAIFLEGFKIRPFSTLVSPQEYGFFMALLVAVILARILHGRRHPALFAYLAVAVGALFLQGTRQVLLLFLVSVLVMLIVRVRSTGGRLVITTLMAFALFAVIPSVVSPKSPATPVLSSTGGSSTAALLAQHQVRGLTDPMSSTAPLHLRMIADGFETSFDHPLGVGLGRGSVAAARMGQYGGSTENDVAAVFAGLGPLGGLLFVAFVITGLVGGVRAYLRRPDALRLAWVGMLVAHLTQWWSGTLYATTSILFIVLGGIAIDAVTSAKSEEPCASVL